MTGLATEPSRLTDAMREPTDSLEECRCQGDGSWETCAVADELARAAFEADLPAPEPK